MFGEGLFVCYGNLVIDSGKEWEYYVVDEYVVQVSYDEVVVVCLLVEGCYGDYYVGEVVEGENEQEVDDEQ